MDPVLRCKDFNSRVVIFTAANYNKHKLKHPELKSKPFFPDNIVKALQKPSFIVPAYQIEATCYYLEEFSINGIMRYTKVIVSDVFTKTSSGEKAHAIMTAFRTDNLKETKYNLSVNRIN